MTGATLIEFAFVLPIFLYLVLGIIQFCLIMYASAVLEGATIAGARAGKTGYTPSSGQTQQQYVYGVIQQRVTGLLNPTQIQMTATSYSGFDTVTAPTYTNCSPPGSAATNPPTPTCSQDLGTSNEIVEYTVAYPWQIIMPFMSAFFGNNGTYTLRSSAIVKNEPYSVGSGGSGLR